MFTNLAAFAERAENAAADAPLGRRVPWQATPLALDELPPPSLAKLEPVFMLWRATRGRISAELDPLLEQLGLGERVIIARQLPRAERLLFERVATGFTLMRPAEWLERIGRDIGDLPDRDYAAKGNEGYFHVAHSRTPRLETVRAVLRNSAGAILRSCYDRLILPWRRRNDLLVLATSALRDVRVSERGFANNAGEICS